MGLMSWIVVAVVAALLIAAYIGLFLYARKRQKAFDEQYAALKERREVFVLNKKVVRESPRAKGILKYAKFKTYQVTGRVVVSQNVRGVQVNRMQVMTFHTTKQEFDKIQPNRKYKMDIAGNYIGFVVAPPPAKRQGAKPGDNGTKQGSWWRRMLGRGELRRK